jgi:hypothetical protein
MLDSGSNISQIAFGKIPNISKRSPWFLSRLIEQANNFGSKAPHIMSLNKA